jgi:protein involved in polysaccharide export with SLBB domain
VLLTGPGIVPDESFRLRPGDVVTIDIPGIGKLTKPVVLVGRDLDRSNHDSAAVAGAGGLDVSAGRCGGVANDQPGR